MIKATSEKGNVTSEVKGSHAVVIADLAALCAAVVQGIAEGNPATRALIEKGLIAAYLASTARDTTMVKFDRSGGEWTGEEGN